MPSEGSISTLMKVRSSDWPRPLLSHCTKTDSLTLVYNHVLKLDLGSLQWTLIDNYGDIPGVRMGE